MFAPLGSFILLQMLGPLLATALAALPPSGGHTGLTLDLAAQLDARTIGAEPYPMAPNARQPGGGHWIGGGATLGLNVYLTPVSDDDAAPPLQPFLQRTTRLRLEGGGSGAAIQYPFYTLNPVAPATSLLPFSTSNRGGRFQAQIDAYVGRWFFLASSFGVDYERWSPDWSAFGLGGFGNVAPSQVGVLSRSDSSELTLAGSVAAGVRWRDVLLSVGWRLSANRVADDLIGVRFWGGAFAGVRAVVRRRIELVGRVEVLEGGARGDVDVTVWLRRRLGLSIGAEGGHGAFVDSEVVFDRAGGHVGIAWWLTPRLGATLAYAPSWQKSTPVEGLGFALPDSSYVAHVVTLTVEARTKAGR